MNREQTTRNRLRYISLLAIAFTFCTLYAPHAAAQDLFLTTPNQEQNNGPKPLFLKKGPANTARGPLFLNSGNAQNKEALYNTQEGKARKFYYKKLKSGKALSHKEQIALAFLESERANYATAITENKRIQQEVAKNLAKVQAESAAIERAGQQEQAANKALLKNTPHMTGEDPLAPETIKKKVIRVYTPDSTLKTPKPVFNSVR